jgi:sterol desaturase/sphingolipid hydroxylase (fatty acid hydroxylase superfamily)
MTADGPVRTVAVMSTDLPPPTGVAVPLRRPRRWPARLAVLALVALGVVLDPGNPLAVPLLFVLVVPFERLFPRHRQPFRREQLGTDIAYGLAAPALALVGVAVAVVIGVASLAWLPGLLLRPLVVSLPASVRLLLGVLLFDVAFYWVHRFSHEVPFLWRFHAVHHSTNHLDWVSAFRTHPVDGALLAPPFVLLQAAGFEPEFTGLLAVVQFATGIFLHANVRWRWRPLHKIVITPEFHHWHHADEPEAHASNYSVFLPLWDLVFGTYFLPENRRPQRYGIGEPMPTGLVHQLRYPLRDLPSPRSAVGFAVRHPRRASRRLARSMRRGLRQLWASARRPTRSFVHSDA